MARPPLQFDDKDTRFVAVLTKYGVKQVDIARELGVDPKTLQKHFGEVIETAAARRSELVERDHGGAVVARTTVMISRIGFFLAFFAAIANASPIDRNQVEVLDEI